MKDVALGTLLVLFVGFALDAEGQVPTPNTQAQQGVERQVGETTLPALVAELERANPELQAARREIDVRSARVSPAGALPDPTVSVGFMNGFAEIPFFPPSSTSLASRQFSFSQEFPFPGKRGLQTNMATTDVETARWSLEATRRRLVADLKAAYFEYAYATRAIAVVQRNKTLLDEMRQVAQAQFSVGKATQQDVLKAQVEISLLLERLAVLEQQRATVQAQINGLLYRDINTPLGAVADYQPISPLPPLDALRGLAGQNSATLKRDETDITRGRQALDLAGKGLWPDFGVTVTTQKYTGDMPWMYGVDFMVRLPLYSRRKQRPQIAEAGAALESATQMRNNTAVGDQVTVAEQYLAATTSRRLADLYSDTILPQARLTLESSLASYRVGAVDFLTLLTNYQTVLAYELSYEEQAMKFRQALARLEPLIGQELVR